MESLYTSTRKVRIMTEDGEYHNNSYEKRTYVVSLQVYMIIINLHTKRLIVTRNGLEYVV